MSSSSFDAMAGMDPQAATQRSADVRQTMRLAQLRDRLAGGETDEAKLKDACQEFEAVLLKQLWGQMRKSVPQNGFLQSKYEEQYRSMFDGEMVKGWAEAGGIGIGDMLFSQMQQRLANATSTTEDGKAIRSIRAEPLPLVKNPQGLEVQRNEGVAIDPMRDLAPGRPLPTGEATGVTTGDPSGAGTPVPQQVASAPISQMTPAELAVRVEALAQRLTADTAAKTPASHATTGSSTPNGGNTA